MQRDVVERPRERRERTVRDVAGHVEHVGLAAGPGRDEPLREAAVVREQQQARRGLVEAADGAEPVERPSFFELCIVPRVPGRGFTIADVYSTGVEPQRVGRRCDLPGASRRWRLMPSSLTLSPRSREGTSRFDAGPRGGNPGGRTSKTDDSVSSRCVTQPAGLCVALVTFTPSSRRCVQTCATQSKSGAAARTSRAASAPVPRRATAARTARTARSSRCGAPAARSGR